MCTIAKCLGISHRSSSVPVMSRYRIDRNNHRRSGGHAIEAASCQLVLSTKRSPVASLQMMHTCSSMAAKVCHWHFNQTATTSSPRLVANNHVPSASLAPSPSGLSSARVRNNGSRSVDDCFEWYKCKYFAMARALVGAV